VPPRLDVRVPVPREERRLRGRDVADDGLEDDKRQQQPARGRRPAARLAHRRRAPRRHQRRRRDLQDHPDHDPLLSRWIATPFHVRSNWPRGIDPRPYRGSITFTWSGSTLVTRMEWDSWGLIRIPTIAGAGIRSTAGAEITGRPRPAIFCRRPRIMPHSDVPETRVLPARVTHSSAISCSVAGMPDW